MTKSKPYHEGILQHDVFSQSDEEYAQPLHGYFVPKLFCVRDDHEDGERADDEATKMADIYTPEGKHPASTSIVFVDI